MTGVLLIFLASTLWALDTLFRYPLRISGVDSTLIVFTEHFLLVLFCLPIFYRFRESFLKASVKDWLYFFVIGAFGSALATVAFTEAFNLISPSLVILLQKFQPLVAIVLARLVLKEPIHKEFLGWAFLCLVGAFFVSHQDIFPGLMKMDFELARPSASALLGYGFTFLAVLSWGSSTVFGKSLTSRGFKESEVMSGRFLMGLLALLPLIGLNRFEFSLTVPQWGQIFAMVFLSGLAGMYIYYMGLSRLNARTCALAEMFFPFAAVSVNWIFLGEALDIWQVLGGVLLLLGSTVIQLRHY